MKKKLLIILIVIVLLGAASYLIYDKYLNKNHNTESTTTQLTQSDETTNTNVENLVEGTYHNDSENEYSYHSAILIVKNQTNSSIDFELSAVHGANKDNVNVGEVKGTAKKIGDNLYQFKEEDNIITFKFDIFKSYSRAEITENYPDNFNPYAGHNVYFSGIYTDDRIHITDNQGK